MAKVVMFGSIGALVETSDIQRRAYNAALREAGLSWQWDRETYTDLLAQAGGRERLAQLSAATGAGLSAQQIEHIHQRKTDIACAEIARGGLKLRPGVAELVRLAKERNLRLAMVTTTYMQNIDAIFNGLGDALAADDFAVIVSRSDVDHGKPAPDAYQTALATLDISPGEALAIEDTANSVMSAKRAGIIVVATPGEYTAGQDFWQADAVIPHLASPTGVLDPAVVAFLN